MIMADIMEKFPDAEVVELIDLIPAEEVGKGPWKLYIYGWDGMHSGGRWFTAGKIKYPDEEITIARAREKAETAIGKGLEVRICDGMDNLVLRAVKGKIVLGETFWNEASPNPVAVAVADRLLGKAKK